MFMEAIKLALVFTIIIFIIGVMFKVLTKILIILFPDFEKYIQKIISIFAK